MTGRSHLGLLVLVVAVAVTFASLPCSAQTVPAGKPADNPAPCTVAPQPVPCGAAPAAAKPAASNKFPFPGEGDSGSGTSASHSSNSSSSPEATQPAANSGGQPPANNPSGANFPFPGENPSPAPGASGSSSSDNTFPGVPAPDGSPALNDKGSEGSSSGRRLLPRVNPYGTKLQSPEEREAEDLNVAHFYSQSGDPKGAYLRSQDAVKTAPDDPDAHFALAEAALKLNKRDEAIAQYKACLKLDPIDKEAKKARKELSKLQPSDAAR